MIKHNKGNLYNYKKLFTNSSKFFFFFKKEKRKIEQKICELQR